MAAPAVAVPAVASADQLAVGEAYMRRYMERTKAPGMAYAVVRGDQVLRQGAWGVDGDGRSMTAQTPFLLGSTSKSFTALAVTQLARAGRIALDDPARTYLPWLRLGAEDTARTVTVRQLLTHTSGLPAVSNSTLTDRYDNSPGGLARSVRDLAAVRPVAAVGQGYRYSDANYMILGALVENVTGETFGGYLRRHVLDPLAMTRSAATTEEAEAVDVPAGHRYYLGRPQRHDTPFDTAGVPYGFLAAGLDDLTHYASAQLGGGRYKDARVLDADAVRQMHTGTANTGHGGRYGLGWKNNTLDGAGVGIVWHSGATPNYFSHVVLVPRSNLAVVVLTNVYALPMDAAFNAGAFDLVRILHGHAPAAAAAEDPLFPRVLAGLLTIAAGLLALLVTTFVGFPRARRRDPARSRRRTVATTAAWLGGCALAAAAAAWLVPTLWGAGFAKVHMWAPDIGDAIVAVVALAGVLALTRIGICAHALRGTRRSSLLR
ncbi:serine hydrolase domain-containing protein [Paractinoplanes ferrugineus]|uniref:serine hydrolase domain-containing protein n=1 Tax=Paractinoplanes ferrugineus TaxID=113564 RepID=UPI00194338C3|nr:serine hydrolase domain-containing protein [Actinoplanes ferrugineus]